MLFPSGSVLLSNAVQLITKLLSADKVQQCYSLEEVSCHDSYQDCWLVLFDKVYNITEFIHNHPGGETVLLEHAGRDASFTFLSAGHGEEMMAVLEDYLIGSLPSDQKMFKTAN